MCTWWRRRRRRMRRRRRRWGGGADVHLMNPAPVTREGGRGLNRSTHVQNQPKLCPRCTSYMDRSRSETRTPSQVRLATHTYRTAQHTTRLSTECGTAQTHHGPPPPQVQVRVCRTGGRTGGEACRWVESSAGVGGEGGRGGERGSGKGGRGGGGGGGRRWWRRSWKKRRRRS